MQICCRVILPQILNQRCGVTVFLTVSFIAIIHESLTGTGQVKLIRIQITSSTSVERLTTNVTQNKYGQKKNLFSLLHDSVHNAIFRETLTYLLTYLLSYLLTQWNRVLLERLTDIQLAKKFPAFYGTRKFITAFTNARYLSLPWANSIPSISPHSTSWRSFLILSSYLSLVPPSSLFPSGFPTKTNGEERCKLLFSIRATCPGHLILLDFITLTISGEEYRSLSSIFSEIVWY